MILNDDAKTIIRNVGSDTPINWRDVQSGVSIVTSYCNMLSGLLELNAQFMASGFASFDDLVTVLDCDRLDLPPYVERGDLLDVGWNMECIACSGWREGPLISMVVEDVLNNNQEVIFEFRFIQRYCDGYLDCSLCDRRLSGMLESEETPYYLRDMYEPSAEFV